MNYLYLPKTVWLCAVAATLIISCNPGDTGKSKADSTAAIAAPPLPLKDELFIKHKVSSYAKWKPVYEADSARGISSGLQPHIVARGVEDSNMVLVIMYIDDMAKAKTTIADPKLKATMQKAGVLGAPEVDYIHRVYTDTTPTRQSARVMIKHKVKDWEAWKKVFDADKPARMAAGLQDKMVGHSVDDNHLVTVVCVVNDPLKAKAMATSKELVEKMKAAGVEGVPDIFFYQVIEKRN